MEIAFNILLANVNAAATSTEVPHIRLSCPCMPTATVAMYSLRNARKMGVMGTRISSKNT